MNVAVEAELAPFLPPAGSFLAAYLDYAGALTDAPLAYHILVGHALLAGTAPPQLVLLGLPGGRVLANFFGVAVGRPAADHKSTAVRIGVELLAEAVPSRLGDINGSCEGLQEALSPPSSPVRLFEVSEFGDFLSMTRQGYAERLKPTLTRMFDGQPIDRRLTRGKRVVVATPRVSCMAAVNTSMLAQYATQNDWDGGFLSRWCFMHAHTERPDPPGNAPPETRAFLLDWLRWAAQRKVAGPVVLSEAARRRWDEWNRDFRRMLLNLPSDARVAAFGRTPTQAAKMALLQAWDYGRIGEDGGTIEEDAVTRAIGLGEVHWRSIDALAQYATGDVDSVRLRTFLAAIPEDGGSIPFGQALRSCMLVRRKGLEMMETLVEMGEIEGRTVDGVFHLRRIVAPRAPVPEALAPLHHAATAWATRSAEPSPEA